VRYKLLILMGLVGVTAGCAQLPELKSAEKPPAQPCADCGPKAPYYAVAVTRPALCNDYPVEYRVQVPETDSRIRPIERVVLGDGMASMSNRSCGK
jgi:hypothetical protein